MSGWVKVHRKTTRWEWYSDLPVRVLFLHLLLTANFRSTKFQGHDIPAGGKVWGRKKLADSCGLSEQSVRTALKKLQNTREITIKSTKKFSIISIVNWENYQDINQQLTNNQPTTNQQLTTEEEGKKERRKEGKKINIQKPDSVSEQTWSDFLALRASKKAPLSQTALSGIEREALKANWTMEEALRECVMRGWRGFKADWVTKKTTAPSGNWELQKQAMGIQ